MPRVGFSAVLVATLAIAALAGPEAVDLSRMGAWRPRVGDRLRVLTGAGPEHRTVWVDEVEEVDDQGRVASRVREYELFEGEPALGGRVRLIERGPVRTHAWLKDGAPAVRSKIEEGLKKRDAAAAEAEWRPTRPVEVGESWSCPLPASLGGERPEKHEARLVRTFERGGARWAEVAVELSLRSASGASLTRRRKLSGPLDGSSPAWVEEEVTDSTVERTEVELLPKAGSPAAAPAPVDLARFDRWRARVGEAYTVSNQADGMAAVLMPLAFRWAFTDTVAEVDGNGRPCRWERTYQAFEDKRLDARLDLLERPIAVAREATRFTFAGKGWALPEFLRERLDEELNESLPYSPDAWRPEGRVSVGSEWPLSPEAVGWLLGRSTMADFQLASASAQLEGTSQRDGRAWAAVRFLIRGKLPGETETELRMVVRAPLDGGSCAREEEAAMRAGKHTRVDWKIVRQPKK